MSDHGAGGEPGPFELLMRASARQVLVAATRARDADPMQFALWGTALAMTPPSLVAVRKVIDYPFLLRAPTEYVERVVLADRLFFVLYAMLAGALFGALVWDALAPSKHDHEVLGVLPVRARTVAVARFAATLRLCMTLLVAVAGPSALLYSAASAVHPLVGGFPRVLVAHLIACVSAGLFVFLTLVAGRALLVVCIGDRLAGQLAVALQIVTFVARCRSFSSCRASCRNCCAMRNREGRPLGGFHRCGSPRCSCRWPMGGRLDQAWPRPPSSAWASRRWRRPRSV